MRNELQIPQYIRLIIGLFGAVLFVFVLIMTRQILIPVTFGLIFSFLLHPLCCRLEKLHIPPSLAAVLCIVFIFLIIGVLIFFVSIQLNNLLEDLPKLKTKMDELTLQGIETLKGITGWSYTKTHEVINNSINDSFAESGNLVSRTLATTTSAISFFIILFVSTFFFLYYRIFFKLFIYKVFKSYNQRYVKNILMRMQAVVQSYIVGLVTVIAIIGTLNSLGLLILGIKYALFFGFVGAILNIIPYIGVALGGLLPAVYAFITKDSIWYPLGVIGVYWLVQIMEANFITPNIVGSKVSLNPFAAILAIIIGEQIWGIAGMILAIPMLAICKVVFDIVGPLKPLGFVLGEPGSEKEKSKTLL
jgi:predicted PurR-regulated permease PerM